MTSESHPTPSRETAEIAGQAPITKEVLTDLIEEHLYGVYHCTRVWSAWHVGTMSQDDFIEARGSELAPDLADAILDNLADNTPELLAALRIAVRQNSHDMLMTGEELRQCEAAIARATGDQQS